KPSADRETSSRNEPLLSSRYWGIGMTDAELQLRSCRGCTCFCPAPIFRPRHHTTVSASGFAAEDAAAGKAEPTSAAFIDVANSFGVRYPKLVCVCAALYSLRDAAPFRRASNRF